MCRENVVLGPGDLIVIQSLGSPFISLNNGLNHRSGPIPVWKLRKLPELEKPEKQLEITK